MATVKRRECVYFYDEEMTNYNYGGGNPMRPHRVKLTTQLVNGYGLTDQMQILRPVERTREEIMLFHADDYVDFLNSVTPDNQEEFMMQMRRFNLGPVGEADCPVFDGMFEYFRMYSGGSVGGAAMINDGQANLVMNWSGGMHHAKKGEASGFCYINDIVLGILELLKTHQRVLYVDIDIHHGDGVEEAFYTTDRVMTVSFHKYGDFFPGTGAVGDIGHDGGKLYAVNVPLGDGMDDESYKSVFEPIMAKVMEMYQPSAIVVCGGADSLSGDKLGCFNLSMQGHSNCIEFLARYNVPLMVLGGGGYTMRNVARCWCFETGQLLGVELDDDIPEPALGEYDYYMDTHKLRIAVSNMKNTNTREALERIKVQVLANLALLPPVPSAQMAPRPPKTELPDMPEVDMDARGGGQAYDDKRVAHDNDYASGDEDVQPARDLPVRPKEEPVDLGLPTVALVDRNGSAPSQPMDVDGFGEGGGEESKPAAAPAAAAARPESRTDESFLASATEGAAPAREPALTLTGIVQPSQDLIGQAQG
ncbi:hypothetical protein ACKKBG_A28510 [Auxenochlorella protothecoides x Auxenochlorella symbiontica]